jgi:cell wall-associated NlpC family hydrolase
MPTTALGPSPGAPTHRVRVPRTLLFPGPDIKLPPLAGLPMGALVAAFGAAEDRNARYALMRPAGAIVEQHLAGLGETEPDFVAVAECFLGTPYLWGGKSTLGIDCSGLVQLSLAMAGSCAPRDTDLQEQALGMRLAGIEPLERGDLVFWKGHVGIMQDGATLLHANAFHMMTASEPLADAVARAEAKGSAVTSVRRMRRSTE